MWSNPQVPLRLIEWLFRLLAFIGGVISTVIGSWVSSKIHVYHDHRNTHHEELKARVLRPLLKTTTQHIPLVEHKDPVVTEGWGLLRFAKEARTTESGVEYGTILKTSNPWSETLQSVDHALLEDAREAHIKELMADVSQLAQDWEAHVDRCVSWVNSMALDILKASGMNSYNKHPLAPPFVLELRLAIFVYMRLFRLPTEALRKEANGQYWTLEGAPGAPNVIGSSTLAPEELVDALLQTMDKVTEANRAVAVRLREESSEITQRTVNLRDRLEFAIASKKLHKRCDFVKFF